MNNPQTETPMLASEGHLWYNENTKFDPATLFCILCPGLEHNLEGDYAMTIVPPRVQNFNSPCNPHATSIRREVSK